MIVWGECAPKLSVLLDETNWENGTVMDLIMQMSCWQQYCRNQEMATKADLGFGASQHTSFSRNSWIFGTLKQCLMA